MIEMTQKEAIQREESIKELQGIYDMMRSYDVDETKSTLMTALKVAISALGSLEEVYTKGYNDGFTQAEVNYENDSERWIPVSERLPEEYGEYLITWKNPKYPKPYIGICECEITDVYDHEHNRFEVEWLFDGYITTAYPDSYVIAWKPLPKPYEHGKVRNE